MDQHNMDNSLLSDEEDAQKNKAMGILAYILFLYPSSPPEILNLPCIMPTRVDSLYRQHYSLDRGSDLVFYIVFNQFWPLGGPGHDAHLACVSGYLDIGYHRHRQCGKREDAAAADYRRVSNYQVTRKRSKDDEKGISGILGFGGVDFCCRM